MHFMFLHRSHSHSTRFQISPRVAHKTRDAHAVLAIFIGVKFMSRQIVQSRVSSGAAFGSCGGITSGDGGACAIIFCSIGDVRPIKSRRLWCFGQRLGAFLACEHSEEVEKTVIRSTSRTCAWGNVNKPRQFDVIPFWKRGHRWPHARR